MKMVDSEGNKLYMGDDGMYLQLKGTIRMLKIFSFNYGKIYKYLKKSNVFQAGKLVGFNYKALQQLNLSEKVKDKNIYIIYGVKRYSVHINDILQLKKFLNFKEKGFETQVFYPFDDLIEITKSL